MGRKKKELANPLQWYNLEDALDYEIQKSMPMFELWKSDLTLSEFKILDVYLARIDSRNSERREVTFSKGEIERLFGLKQIKPEVLDERLEHLMRTNVSLQLPGTEKIDRISLFERGQAERDKNGMWMAVLTCTEAAKKYIFSIEKIGYWRYKLRNSVNLSSLYSYNLFMYLEKNRHIHLFWEQDIDFLKEYLGCAEEEIYKEFKYFNQRVLRRCHEEINKKTECKYAYTLIKRGRFVERIRFELEPLSILEDEGLCDFPAL